MTGPLFRLRGVTVERGGRRVLGPVDLDIPGDGPVVISGPSGSGKSSLLRLLNRLDAPASGTVTMSTGDGHHHDLAAQDPCAHRRRVAMVFQRPVVLPGTVADNLRQADADLDDRSVEVALTRVGLDADLADRPARDLSGGEAQRLCLARSLATDPQVVLFDEPTSALDPDNTARIEALACSLANDGITSIWVTHDREQQARLAHHAITVVDGRIDEQR